jgi:pyrroloquinoline quinone (PQQ) biosynthesis protein C
MRTLDVSTLRNGDRHSPEEAEEIVKYLYGLASSRWDEKVTQGRFMQELVNGTLPMETIQLFWRNWYGFVAEINNFMGVTFQRFTGWFKLHPELLATFSDKIADELRFPRPPGHILIVLQQGREFGLSDEDQIHARMLPECRAWLDWARGIVYEGSMIERWCFHTVEERIGEWSRTCRLALGKEPYSFTKERLEYFQTHEDADLGTHADGVMGHGPFNKLMLQALIEEGQILTRPGMPLDYIAQVTADFAGLFFEGVYREAVGETNYGWR